MYGVYLIGRNVWTYRISGIKFHRSLAVANVEKSAVNIRKESDTLSFRTLAARTTRNSKSVVHPYTRPGRMSVDVNEVRELYGPVTYRACVNNEYNMSTIRVRHCTFVKPVVWRCASIFVYRLHKWRAL